MLNYKILSLISIGKIVFEGSPKRFAHCHVTGLHASLILIKIMNLMTYTDYAFLVGCPMHFAPFFLIREMMSYKITI